MNQSKAEPSEKNDNKLILPDSTQVEITPFGSDDRIRLTITMVRNMIAVPTKSGAQPDDRQCIKFMMLCRARHLNPFEGDAYLIGYDTASGPQFSLITAHQVFLKRAEASKGFRGMASGVIVRAKDNDENGKAIYVEREGDLVYPEETLVGGWAKVHRKELEYPFYKRLKLATFNTGKSRWEKDPAGMIVKCAEADALRTAFPTHLGGLYMEEERQPIDVKAEVIPIERPVIPEGKRGRRKAEPPEVVPTPTPPPPIESDANYNEETGHTTKGPEPAKKKSSESPTSTSKKFILPPAEEKTLGENEAKLINRLRNKLKPSEDLCEAQDRFVTIVTKFGGLDQGQNWSDLNEEKFKVFLHPDNWKLIEENW